MVRRHLLHNIFKAITANVYFQPPTSMLYPCIMYQLDGGRTRFADDIPYGYDKRYQVTIIDKNPDSALFDKVAALPTAVFDRFYVANNLNHFVFTLYF